MKGIGEIQGCLQEIGHLALKNHDGAILLLEARLRTYQSLQLTLAAVLKGLKDEL